MINVRLLGDAGVPSGDHSALVYLTSLYCISSTSIFGTYWLTILQGRTNRLTRLRWLADEVTLTSSGALRQGLYGDLR